MSKLSVILYIGLLVVLMGCGKKDAVIPQTRTEGHKPQPSKTATAKLISNPIVEKKVREELKKPKGKLTKADLGKVKELHLVGNELTEVPRSLEHLTQLTYLGLNSNQLTDAKELAKFTQLTKLELANNKLGDLKGLEKLTELKELHLSINQLTNLKGLEKLAQLTVLDLSNNQLANVDNLRELTQLEKLLLSENELTDVKGLEKLTQLTLLTLHNNQLTKAQLTDLQKALPNCKISHDFDM